MKRTKAYYESIHSNEWNDQITLFYFDVRCTHWIGCSNSNANTNVYHLKPSIGHFSFDKMMVLKFFGILFFVVLSIEFCVEAQEEIEEIKQFKHLIISHTLATTNFFWAYLLRHGLTTTEEESLTKNDQREQKPNQVKTFQSEFVFVKELTSH